MAKRRTLHQINDMIGRPVKPGDIIAVSTKGGYGSTSVLRLVVLKHIYLDDSKGQPYHTFPVYYRDPATGLLHHEPTDEKDSTTSSNPVVDVPESHEYVTVKTNYPVEGWDYSGNNELVALQQSRIVGQPIDEKGNPVGKIATYEPSNFILVAGVTLESLQN